MPPDRPKSKPFKPPRPSAATSTTKKPGRTASTPASSHPEPDTLASSLPSNSAPAPALSSASATIPPELLTRLLHEFFTDDRMRISKGADRAVGKYMETFVREAIARAAFERSETEKGASGGDGFLEVEDLERLAPQLVLDF